MAKSTNRKYRNKAVVNGLFFLISMALVILSTVWLFSSQEKWKGYFIIIEKQEATLEEVNTLFKIKKEPSHDNKLDRLVSNYDLFLRVLSHKNSLISGPEKINVAKTDDLYLNELKSASSDTWQVLKVNILDQRNGAMVSNKEFQDNISDLRHFQTTMKDRITKLSKETLLIHYTAIGLSTLLLITSLLFLLIIYHKYLSSPLQTLKNRLNKLNKGEQLETEGTENGFLNEVIHSVDNINQFYLDASKALMEYGYGNFDYVFKRRSSKDKLGRSIEQMRFRIKDIIDEDRKKSTINNRINLGMAQFSDILQKNSHDIKILIDKFVTELVSYFEANQGALYILNESADQLTDQELELQFTYAWNRKKYKSDSFKVGDNLAGQAVLENDTIYMTNVPDNYIEITSGIGKSSPKSLLIVPLKLNEQPKGVLEIASLKEFEKYEIELIEKLCENLASTITNTLANEKTRQLLDDARGMTSAMKEQEDLMRRNQEEMQMEQEASKREISRLEAQLEEIKHQKERLEQDLSQYVNA